MEVMPILYKKVCRNGGSMGWWGQLSAGTTVLLCPGRQDTEQEGARPKSTQRGRKQGGGQVPDAENVDVDAAEEEEAGEDCTFRVQGTEVDEKFPTAPKPQRIKSQTSLALEMMVTTSGAEGFLGKEGGEGERGSNEEKTFLCAGLF